MDRYYFLGDDGGVKIPVTISDTGSVNVGCTSELTVEDFARLAASVLSASNTKTGGWMGFPACNDLVPTYGN